MKIILLSSVFAALYLVGKTHGFIITPRLIHSQQQECCSLNNAYCRGDESINNNHGEDADVTSISRRLAIKELCSATLAASTVMIGLSLQPEVVFAATDEKPKEFIDVGTQAPAPEGEAPFVELLNGVKVKDFKPGSGAEVVKADSSVQIQCSGKLLNLNGVSFYNTKNNNPDGFGAVPLAINLGRGDVIPGLESGIVGMRKGGIRRIIIPADLAYSKFPLLEPQPIRPEDQRALDSVIKNPRRDATIMFDVSIERFK